MGLSYSLTIVWVGLNSGRCPAVPWQDMASRSCPLPSRELGTVGWVYTESWGPRCPPALCSEGKVVPQCPPAPGSVCMHH
uniref:Chemerin vd n=1 Tax=Gallus gallus gallus TaxID=208526 RepID=A0A7S4ZDW4_CHICK|nr:chemerin vd [Gallus gallus gallus]